MNNIENKKIKKVVKVIFYVVLCATVATSVFILILVTNGYWYDIANNKIEQRALIQFNSTPTGASVIVDGKSVSGNTANKVMVDPGTHIITIKKDGYQPWSTKISAKSGSLIWVNYARLIPNAIKTKTIKKYSKVDQSVSSPDGKFIILQPDTSLPKFELINIDGDDTNYSALIIPNGGYTISTDNQQQFKIMSWNNDDKNVIIKHSYENKIEWLDMNLTDSTTKNLSQIFDLSFIKIEFSSDDGNSIYVLCDNGDLRKIDIGSSTMSRAIIDNLIDFNIYNNKTIAYKSKKNDLNDQQIGIYQDGNNLSSKIMNARSDETVNFALTSYYGNDYLVVSVDNKIYIYAGSFPKSESDDSLKLANTFVASDKIINLSFGRDGRIVVFKDKNNTYGYYDIERQVGGVSSNTIAFDGINWFDGSYYLWADVDNKLSIWDFNGDNKTNDLLDVASNQIVVLNDNGKYLYSFYQNKKTNMIELQRTSMIIN